MKKARTVVITLAVLAGGYLSVAHLSGGAFWTMGLPLGGDRGLLRRIALEFMEDIQFKDFEAAASYHAPELMETVDIPFLIQRLFQVRPEALDFMDYEVVLAEVDSSGLRARVRMRVTVRLLLDELVQEKEFILYFYRDSVSDPWYMRLEDSLREAAPEEGLQH